MLSKPIGLLMILFGLILLVGLIYKATQGYQMVADETAIFAVAGITLSYFGYKLLRNKKHVIITPAQNTTNNYFVSRTTPRRRYR